ncbi:hypothetical protein Vretimale_2436 [Volvox reticuliferus]|uniref:Uncharacterized protein n=1 Tax=Volvox reticuliferus TaxID=1737510 RepID=A0A8J4C6A2_9CHLO|nr:hypothetical protein Vretifemale_4736 [Volvox reticuliferus]GIL96680.1 hypothetical protein Vretimale_2436 [Volvox reticuliferus]
MTDPSSFTFSLLTYNINDGMISESAPTGWTLDEQHDRLSDLICERRPDLLCLQECFTFPSKLMGDYDFHGEVPSHRGSCFIGTLKDAPLRVGEGTLPLWGCVGWCGSGSAFVHAHVRIHVHVHGRRIRSERIAPHPAGANSRMSPSSSRVLCASTEMATHAHTTAEYVIIHVHLPPHYPLS